MASGFGSPEKRKDDISGAATRASPPGASPFGGRPHPPSTFPWAPERPPPAGPILGSLSHRVESAPTTLKKPRPVRNNQALFMTVPAAQNLVLAPHPRSRHRSEMGLRDMPSGDMLRCYNDPRRPGRPEVKEEKEQQQLRGQSTSSKGDDPQVAKQLELVEKGRFVKAVTRGSSHYREMEQERREESERKIKELRTKQPACGGQQPDSRRSLKAQSGGELRKLLPVMEEEALGTPSGATAEKYSAGRPRAAKEVIPSHSTTTSFAKAPQQSASYGPTSGPVPHPQPAHRPADTVGSLLHGTHAGGDMQKDTRKVKLPPLRPKTPRQRMQPSRKESLTTRERHRKDREQHRERSGQAAGFSRSQGATSEAKQGQSSVALGQETVASFQPARTLLKALSPAVHGKRTTTEHEVPPQRGHVKRLTTNYERNLKSQSQASAAQIRERRVLSGRSKSHASPGEQARKMAVSDSPQYHVAPEDRDKKTAVSGQTRSRALAGKRQGGHTLSYSLGSPISAAHGQRTKDTMSDKSPSHLEAGKGGRRHAFLSPSRSLAPERERERRRGLSTGLPRGHATATERQDQHASSDPTRKPCLSCTWKKKGRDV